MRQRARTVTHCIDIELIHVWKECLATTNRVLEYRRKKRRYRFATTFAIFSILENDVLSYIIAVTHDINTRTNSAPVNIRPYRLPEKYKEEANKQIKKMLEEKIIQHSTRQWNTPLLVFQRRLTRLENK